MGYSLYIGEAEPDIRLEDRYATIHVTEVCNDEAPLNSTDCHCNYCRPSYSAWADFCRRHGMEELFLARAEPWWKDSTGKSRECLIARHPGAAALDEEHLKAFQAALDAEPQNRDTDPEVAEYDLRRLKWLVWWTDWALKNCKYPTFYNS